MPEISSRTSCIATFGSFEKSNSTMMLAKLSSGVVPYRDESPDTRTKVFTVLPDPQKLMQGHDIFAIPFNAMTLDTRDHTFTLDIARERLAGAPGFDKEAWPDMTDRSWGERIYGFYDVQPYWM